MKLKVDVLGLKDVDAALGKLSKPTGRNVLRRVLTRAGEPIAERARELAAIRSGQLKDSIVVSAKLKNPTGQSEFAAAMRAGLGQDAAVAALRDARRESSASFAEIYVGPSVDAPHAHLVEFGTAHSAPRPFMRPAWDQQKGVALTVIASDLRAEVDAAVARAARKQARRSR